MRFIRIFKKISAILLFAVICCPFIWLAQLERANTFSAKFQHRMLSSNRSQLFRVISPSERTSKTSTATNLISHKNSMTIIFSKTNSTRCRKKFLTVAPDLKRGSTEIKTLYMDGIGRLGNKMFQYAALIGLARKRGYEPLIPTDDILLETFNISHVTKTRLKDLTVFSEKAAGRYDSCVETMPTDRDWKLNGYYQSWKYFLGAEDEVRKEFTFKTRILQTVNNTLTQMLKNDHRGKVKIGVHVRRGDMLSIQARKKGYTVAPKEYFLRAMKYYRKKLKNPLFIVCSEDIMWCKKNLGYFKNTIFMRSTKDHDLAILASCDHSIISTGSFGWWSAWLAGGQTVYYKNFPRNGSWLASQYLAEDYFPAHWIGME